MKRKLIVIGLLSLSILLGISLIYTVNKNTIAKSNSKLKFEASYKKINGLDELKKQATIIAEVEGTESYKLMDYSGITARISTVNVIDIVKGDKSLKQINIIQTEGLDTEKPPVKGEKLLIFLRKSQDIKDTYIPLGGSQGTYNMVTASDNIQLKPNSMVNNDILRDLNGKYSDVKKKLAQ